MTTGRSRRRRRLTTRSTTAAAATIGVLALGACSLSGGGNGGEETTDGGSAVVRLVTHDSFAISDDVRAAFEESSGYTIELINPGDGGALVNQLILTKDSPLGDAVYGVDNTFASRAIDEGVFAEYVPSDVPASAEPYRIDGAEDLLTPVDVGDVCLNVDHAWFTERGLAEPAGFEDLLKPEYRDLTVVTNPATSSPGLAFLLATVGAFGEDGWLDYWAQLRDNGLSVVDGWEDAYYVDFSGAGGGGPRPIVLSYSSSPAFTVGDDGGSTTGALLDTCFRQVEYAGVIAGAENPEGAQALVDFLLSEDFQADLPEQMYVYPVDDAVELPAEWVEFAPLAPEPFEVAPADIAEHRDSWIEQWTDTVIG
ncbi:ABC transporter, periplasmic binding protein, thiB subfamily [Beutenbergia cavernae DSM 12333]|uniref:ABC transporter, periplasmic binding protein, thiB subfamily n=1 Tax=Beutenbergia cavernae (strain ATCC BAA-8 / DSM 12333 / CCUG 43141 / JCM 11478 / NBRC 16432 / NCIMB 13614 / HKI 0122) TaxID=471853 RepID=C5C4C7_BEUC1|nr:thiamine ABC transporter substrate-binding protein [Beutenbergia cavernae]ACQ82051.1 ABC transporter, periplasmic binding protein, thiB subfamily [Beutenbergia cavernae DSM 12333]